MVQLIFGQNYCCVVRGFKVVSIPTLPHVEVNHVAEHVGPSSTDGPDVGWQLLVDVGDGHGLTMQRPPPHRQDVTNGVDETTHIKS